MLGCIYGSSKDGKRPTYILRRMGVTSSYRAQALFSGKRPEDFMNDRIARLLTIANFNGS